MKKRIMLIMAVLMLAAPASAEVKIICTADGYDVTVSYNAGSEVELVRAFALDIEVSSGAIITDFNTVPSFDIDYPIHPGSIIIIGNDVNDYGSPICANSYPGTLPGINTPGITVEYGSLYVGDGNAPDPCGVMFTFTVSGDCIVCITENRVIDGILTMRSGVVLEDPTLAVEVNSPCFMVGHGGCAVPDVVGMAQADANTAIIDAGFTVGNITTAYSDVIAYGDVISSSPAAEETPGCDTAVDIVVSLASDCYLGMADEAEWIEAGRPTCWCYPRQCHGDADGKMSGNQWTGYYAVSGPDLSIMSLGWMEPDPPFGTGILGLYKEPEHIPVACADFDRVRSGNEWTGYYRISSLDLSAMSLYWMEPEPGFGTGTPGDCDPNNRTPPQ